jgi:hypothetical protein
MSDGPPAQEVTLSLRERRKLLFSMLSILWIFPSAGAVWIISRNSQYWKTSGRWTEVLSSIRLEDWTALLLLLAQVTFVIQAIRYRRRCQNASTP